MADAVNAKISLSLKATYTKDLDLGDATDPIVKTKTHTLSTLGAGAASYNVQWRDSRSIAAATDDDLDLSGSLTDAFGATVAFARFKVLGIWSTNLNTADTHLKLGGGSNYVSTLFAAAGDILLAPKSGGSLIIACDTATGYVVTATTADILRITNASAGTIATYDIVILGASS